MSQPLPLPVFLMKLWRHGAGGEDRSDSVSRRGVVGSLGSLCLVQMSGKPKPTTSALSWFHTASPALSISTIFNLICSVNFVFNSKHKTLFLGKCVVHWCAPNIYVFREALKLSTRVGGCLHWQSPLPTICMSWGGGGNATLLLRWTFPHSQRVDPAGSSPHW